MTLRLAASAQRAAATIEVEPEDGDLPTTFQMVTGPALGPWVGIAPPASTPPFPLGQQVDGDRVFTTEHRRPGTAVVVRDPDPRDVPATGREAAFATFAGDLMAYATTVPGKDDTPRRLVIAEWRTGAVRRTVDLPAALGPVALRPDGRVALVVQDPGDLYDIRPGKRPRRYGVGANQVRFAGEHIVFTDLEETRASVIDPDGTVRRFGLPTRSFGGFTTDDRNVLWVANGCLLAAPPTSRFARALGPGPCPRSEVDVGALPDGARFARSLPIRVRCVAAPRRCAGRVNLVWTRGDTRRTRVDVGAGTRFTIPAGRSRTVRVRFSDAGMRRLRAHFRRHARATLAVEPVTDDGSRLSAVRSRWVQIRRERPGRL